ncbi:unnamed protein product, partial [Didymodactylos carnosus]
ADCQNMCNDRDCSKNSRCCDTNNQCHEECSTDEITRTDQFIPRNVVAIERKSRKTVKLKWHHIIKNETEPIFYVIEAQWSLNRKQPFTRDVSKWGFLKEEVSHNKAIIRNIHRGRWYSFRVAAVTRHGRSAFSQPTAPFRLTAEPKSHSPTNFTVKSSVLNDDGSYNVTLAWIQQSQNDLPISGYKISWEPVSDVEQIAADEVLINEDLSSTSLHEYKVPYLNPKLTYRFKIRSVTSYGDLTDVGPFTTIIYQINSLTTSTTSALPLITLPSSTSISFLPHPPLRHQRHREYMVISDLKISEPFFINGLLKANVSWTINDKQNDYSSQIQQFDLYWLEVNCTNDVSCCYRRDAATVQNQFQIYDLRFNCTYALNVPSCANITVFGAIRPPCPTTESKNKALPFAHSLVYNTFSILVQDLETKYSDIIYTSNKTGTNTIGINLQWNSKSSQVQLTGYRLKIEQLDNHEEILNIDLAPITSEYYYPNLSPNTLYNVTLSSINNHKYIILQQSIIFDGYSSRNNSKNTVNYRHFTSNTDLRLSSSSSSSILHLSRVILMLTTMIFLVSIVYR